MYSLKHLNRLVGREQYMLNQARNNLLVTIELVEKQHRTKGLTLDESIYEGYKKSLSSEETLSWALVNQIEQSVVEDYDDVMLLTEWQRQLSLLEYLPGNLARFYEKNADSTSTDKVRTLLISLIKDLQWSRESNRVIRFTENQMRKKTIALFLMSFVLFLSPTITRLLFGSEFDNLRLYYIFTAATSGILGASFSQLTSIQSRVQSATLDQVRAMSQMGYILARAMVGAGAGLIMFYLLQSGLLSGAFFPQFIHSLTELETYSAELGLTSAVDNRHGVSQAIESSLAIGTLAQPAEGLSLLIVWCLIAGFSEKMIPGILNKKAKEASTEKEAQ